MSQMPPPGPQRTRLFVLLGLLVIAMVVLYYQWTGDSTVPVTTTARSSANPVDKLLNETSPTSAKTAQKPAAGTLPSGQVPEALKLDQIENKVPDEPEAQRNLFRFGQPPPPPPPPPVKYVAPPPPVDPGPPPPPPIPPIPLRYVGYIKDTEGRNRASFSDRSGNSFEGIEGQVVDGKYRLHRVTPTSVEMSYLNGTGRRSIPLNGGGG